MSTAISFISKNIPLIHLPTITFDIPSIFRNQTFKAAAEFITISSFFIGAAIWIIALSEL